MTGRYKISRANGMIFQYDYVMPLNNDEAGAYGYSVRSHRKTIR